MSEWVDIKKTKGHYLGDRTCSTSEIKVQALKITIKKHFFPARPAIFRFMWTLELCWEAQDRSYVPIVQPLIPCLVLPYIYCQCSRLCEMRVKCNHSYLTAFDMFGFTSQLQGSNGWFSIV